MNQIQSYDSQAYASFDTYNLNGNDNPAGGAHHIHPESQVKMNQHSDYTAQSLMQLPQYPQNPVQPVHPTVFYYQPSNDSYHYHINCKEISYNTISSLLNKLLNKHIQFNENEYVFFYQQYDGRIYQVICEIVSPSLITNYLNKNVHGHDIKVNVIQERLAFTYEQKENIEFYLTQYLSQFLLN